jgi:hypothetical protein
MSDESLTNKKGAARYLNCSIPTVERLMREPNGLQFVKFTKNGVARFRYTDLADFVGQRLQRRENTPRALVLEATPQLPDATQRVSGRERANAPAAKFRRHGGEQITEGQ